MKRRSRVILLSIIGVAIVAVVTLSIAQRRRAGALETVDSFIVSVEDMTETISGTGNLVPAERRTVFSRVSGVVRNVGVDEGDVVDAGTRLLEIDDRDYQHNLEKARIAFRSTRRSALQQILNLQSSYVGARRRLTKATRTHANNRELREANAISNEQFQQSEEALADAEQALRLAREQLNLYTGREITEDPITSSELAEQVVDGLPEVRQAALAVRQAQDALSDTRPRAPITGTVAMVATDEGGLVTPNAPLARLERLDSMKAEIQIDEVDIGKISLGDPAVVESDSMLGESLEGSVESIAPTVARVGNTRVSAVAIQLHDNPPGLKSGASCTVRIRTTTKEDALTVPITAYETEGDDTYVFVLNATEDDGRYRLERRSIELGIVTVNLVEVVVGLSEGERIAVGNLSELRDDMVVGVEEDE
jgi:HlyD family secretion protein